MSRPQATQGFSSPLSRRHLLLYSALLAAACNRSGTFGNEQDPLGLRLVYWGYEPQLLAWNLDRFSTQYPGLQVLPEAFSSDYFQTVSLLLNEGQPIDTVYVRETDLSAWAEAGWLEPLDEFNGINQYRDSMMPQAAEGIQYKGVTYGLPYYTECAHWVYDESILQSAGITLPPATWEEVTQQAREIKRRGLIEYPIRFTYRFHTSTNIDWWSMVYSRGGTFFDEVLNPIFHLAGSAAEQTLAWLLDGIYSTEIIHADILGSSYEAALRNPTAFTIQPGYNFLFNVQEGTNAPGSRRIALFPGNEPTQSGSVMWTRLYAIPRGSQNKEAAWELLQYLGGLDRENRYFTPLFWFVNRSLGSAYASLYAEPQVRSLAEERGLEDMSAYLQQRQVARAHEGREVPWFQKWEHISQLEIQRVLLRQVSPREALQQMADKFYELRIEWSAVTARGAEPARNATTARSAVTARGAEPARGAASSGS